jgi:hypothetical protein
MLASLSAAQLLHLGVLPSEVMPRMILNRRPLDPRPLPLIGGGDREFSLSDPL